jgi:hypothetical protein
MDYGVKPPAISDRISGSSLPEIRALFTKPGILVEDQAVAAGS